MLIKCLLGGNIKMDEEREVVKQKIIEIVNNVNDINVLKYLLIFMQGKIKVG